MTSKRGRWGRIILVAAWLLSGCSRPSAPVGSADNPVRMYFTPVDEITKIVQFSHPVMADLQRRTGYRFKTATPTSYAAVIEAMGSGEADVAWLPTFAYVLARQKFGVHPSLICFHGGADRYRGEILVRADSPIHTLKDLEGKRIAYTDAASTSGHVYPAALLAKNGVTVGKSLYAGGHPQAVLAVLGGATDAAAVYWNPPHADGSPNDARALVLQTNPDVYRKLRVLAWTDWIPNDMVAYRKGFPRAAEQKIDGALEAMLRTPEGRKSLGDLYGVDGLAPVTDARYDSVRAALKALGKSAGEFVSQ